MRIDRRACSAAAAQRRHLRSRLVGGDLTKVYFDGGSRPNPGPIRVAAVVRGVAYIRDGNGNGPSGDAEWAALIHALEVAAARGERDVVMLGDSASVIDQANGVARRRAPDGLADRFEPLCSGFERVRFRHIRRNQNLAGIVLDKSYHRGPVA